jgi:hypothetical protein
MYFCFENAGELHFIARERERVPIQIPSLIRGPNMRGSKAQKLAYETNKSMTKILTYSYLEYTR